MFTTTCLKVLSVNGVNRFHVDINYQNNINQMKSCGADYSEILKITLIKINEGLFA